VFAALAIAALLVAFLVAWRHDLAEGGRPMLVVSSREDDLENLASSAEQSVRARLSSLGASTSRDERWFPAFGARPGLTLTGKLSPAGAKVRLDLAATHSGSMPHHTHLLFSRSLLSEHVGVVGDPILKALHVDRATGRLIAANEVDPEEGDALLLAAAGFPSPAQAPSAPASASLSAAGSTAPVRPASTDASVTAVAASAPNTPSLDAGSTAEQPGTVDPRPALLVAQLRDAVKASPVVGELGQYWVDASIGKDQVTRVRAAFFDAARFTVRAVLSKVEQGSHVQDVEPPAGSVFIINGGEFREVPSGAPDAARVSVGLIYSNGSVMSDADAAYSKGGIPRGGLFALEARMDGAVRTILLPRRAVGNRIDLAALGKPRDLLQTKWALIHPNAGELPCGPSTMAAASGGVQGICGDDPRVPPYARSAFCTRPNEFGFVTVTGHNGLSLYQFMNLLAAPRAEGGFACETALNLDGANTIQFRRWSSAAGPGRRLLHEYRADRRAANFLAVTPR